ncbi:MutS-related protein [Flagellimonas lutaonensis]|uniref:DNA mismatch repair protein mutS n=1 Tax=Flagellimonas lutaonensis TaxID=516051 RepID=A0A0D5YSS0_9FLAO|nr:hypothetical protein [Allomuricauda lutaonensis]AKA35362.1 DNA mismatch repair protein mutS [Allomuricauda lutaonensis]
MQKLIDFYGANLTRYTGQSNKVQRWLQMLSYSRLVLFLLTILAVYLLRFEAKWAVVGTFLGMAAFLGLVRYYQDVKKKYCLLHALVKVNATEIEVLQHNFEELPSGEEYVDDQHCYSHDLDLFGKGSFFQYLNRAQLQEGKDALAQMFTANDIGAITAKQETVDDLAQKPKWRQDFTARAMLIQQQTPVSEITKWLKQNVPFVPGSMRFLPWLFLVMTLFLGAMAFWQGWSWSLLGYWILLGLGLTGRYFRRIQQLAQMADRIKAVFKQYSSLLTSIEETEFEAAQLRYQKQRLLVDDKKASEAIADFARLLNTMDYNNNIFYAIFGNGCFLGALQTAHQIEKWIGQHKEQVADWFEVIALFDAYNSLGNFAFNHPLYCYPVIHNGPQVLACKAAGHPLIPEEKNVRNDFTINHEDFFIITGSNMAGKSTFLRTTGLLIVMANMGLPVCAEECLYSPNKLVTSMRSIDSLSKGDSYFLSELKRLKFIIDLLQEEPYFVVLDEILKGTNSTDKAAGSKRFLHRLVQARATGLIATHDLSLCEAADDLPQVHNYYLDATIQEGELYFDYRLKKGVSKTMNASFLLEKMDIV